MKAARADGFGFALLLCCFVAAAAAAEEPDANETNGESASRDESNQGRRGLGEGGKSEQGRARLRSRTNESRW